MIVFLMIVLVEVLIIRLVKEGKEGTAQTERTRKRWSLQRAALYGIVFSLINIGLQVWRGTLPSSAPNTFYALGILAVALGLFPLLFVAIAAIRNAILRNTIRSPEDVSLREWTAADKEEFKLMGDQRR